MTRYLIGLASLALAAGCMAGPQQTPQERHRHVGDGTEGALHRAQPPSAHLVTAEGQHVAGVLGSYCWPQGGLGVGDQPNGHCEDKPGVVELVDDLQPAQIPAGTRIQVHFGDEPPVNSRLVRWDGGVPQPLEAGPDGSFVLPPGEHVIDLAAEWRPFGMAAYGFRVTAQ